MREDAVRPAAHEPHQRMSVRPGEAWALYAWVRLIQPETAVEIGRLEGISSEWILHGLQDNELRDKEQAASRTKEKRARGHLHSIDKKTTEASTKRLAPWIAKKMVTIHEFDSHGPEAKALAERIGTIQFLFVDGCHAPDAVEADCRLWLPRVRGYAVFHDWAFEGVRVGIRRAVPLETFSRYVASKEHMVPGQAHTHGHGVMVLYLPDGLRSMPAERPGRPG